MKQHTMILEKLYYRPYIPIIIVILSISAAFGGLPRLKIGSNTREFLPVNNLERKYNENIEDTYDITSNILIAYHSKQDLINELVPIIAEVSQKIKNISLPEELSPDKNSSKSSDLQKDSISNLLDDFSSDSFLPVQDLQSITSISILQAQGDSFEQIKPSENLLQNPGDEHAKEVFRQELESWDLYRQALYSKDFKYGAIIISPNSKLDSKQRSDLHYQIREILKDYNDTDIEFFLSGEDIIQSVIGDFILKDLVKLIPFLILVICAILLLFFRSFPALFIILFPVFYALLLTIGLMAWLGIKFTFIHASIPVIIMALGSADSIHTLIHYIHLDRAQSPLQRILQTHRSLIRAITLTSLTTSIGFLSLSSSIMPPIRSFGIFSAVGIAFSWLASAYLTPLLIAALKNYIPTTRSASSKSSHICYWVHQKLMAHPVRNLCLLGFLIFCLGFAVPYVSVNNDTLRYFRSDAEIVKASNVINRELGGMYSLHISLSSKKEGVRMTEPRILEYMDGLADQIQRENPGVVAKTIGLNSFVAQINQVFNPGTARIPENRALVAQYLSFYTDGLETFSVPDILSPEHARLSLYLTDSSSKTIHAVLESIYRYRDANLPEPYDQIESGYALIINSMNQVIVREQLWSIFFALIGVFLVLLLVFRSLKYSILACLPPLITLLFNFSLMAVLRIDLNISTALITGLIIGVGIDYSIHWLSLFQQNRQNQDQSLAIKTTLQQISGSILLNALAVGLGYSVLLASQFRSLAYFGGLSALANIISAFLSLVIVPFFLEKRKLNKKFIIS